MDEWGVRMWVRYFGGGSDKLKYVNWMDMKGVRSNIDRWIAEA